MGNVRAAKFFQGRSGERCNLCGGTALPRRSASFDLDLKPLLCPVKVSELGLVTNGARRRRLRSQSLRCAGAPVPSRTCSHSPASFPAIIEHVRDGSVVRALLLPDYYLVTVMLSGIKVKPRSEGSSERTAREGGNK